jgi:hypothetical protein
MAIAESGWGFGGQVYKGSSVEWYTPPRIFEALGIVFDLDPCAPPLPYADWIPARRRYSLPDDGLALPWTGRVWLNPPYGREAARWVDKLTEHGNGVALVFARTDAAWAQRAMAAADAVCLVAKRLSFVAGVGASQDLGHNAGAPSMLLAYGAHCARAVINSQLGLTWGKR